MSYLAYPTSVEAIFDEEHSLLDVRGWLSTDEDLAEVRNWVMSLSEGSAGIPRSEEAAHRLGRVAAGAGSWPSVVHATSTYARAVVMLWLVEPADATQAWATGNGLGCSDAGPWSTAAGMAVALFLVALCFITAALRMAAAGYRRAGAVAVHVDPADRAEENGQKRVAPARAGRGATTSRIWSAWVLVALLGTVGDGTLGHAPQLVRVESAGYQLHPAHEWTPAYLPPGLHAQGPSFWVYGTKGGFGLGNFIQKIDSKTRYIRENPLAACPERRSGIPDHLAQISSQPEVDPDRLKIDRLFESGRCTAGGSRVPERAASALRQTRIMTDRGRDGKAGEAANQASRSEAVTIIHTAIEEIIGEAGEDVGSGRVDLALRIAVGELAKDMATNEGGGADAEQLLRHLLTRMVEARWINRPDAEQATSWVREVLHSDSGESLRTAACGGGRLWIQPSSPPDGQAADGTKEGLGSGLRQAHAIGLGALMTFVLGLLAAVINPPARHKPVLSRTRDSVLSDRIGQVTWPTSAYVTLMILADTNQGGHGAICAQHITTSAASTPPGEWGTTLFDVTTAGRPAARWRGARRAKQPTAHAQVIQAVLRPAKTAWPR
jgi:hypothetical protein